MIGLDSTQHSLSGVLAQEDSEDIIFASTLPSQRAVRASEPARAGALRRPATTLDDDEEIIFAQSWPATAPGQARARGPVLRAVQPVVVAPVVVAPVVVAPVVVAPVVVAPVVVAPVVVAPVVVAPAVVAPELVAPAVRPVGFPMVDVDVLWQDFDLEITQDLAAGHCPHCDSVLQLTARQLTVTCALRGSTYATFHAWAREGNA